MGKPLRVLLIEDSDDDAQLILRELRRIGYDVEFDRVETAEAMQVVLTEKTWEVILSDYTMPKFSALGALQVLKASGLDLPFIIISGTIGEETAVAALKAGAHDFIIKGKFARLGPVIEQELLEAEIRRKHEQAEQALQTSEELFGTAFHHSPVGICITTMDGKLQNVSQSLADMLGFTRTELEGKHFNEITHPDDLKFGNEAMGRMMSGKVPSVSFEKRYLHKSGEPIWALVSSSLLRDSSGQPVHFITHILNMTERKQAEEQLRFHASIVESAADAIISKTMDGTIISWNLGAESLYGYKAEEVIGKPITIISPPERLHEFPIILERIRNGERIKNFETIRLTKDGQRKNMSLTISPILDHDGQILGASTIGHDITELKRVVEALRQSEENFSKAFSSSPVALMITRLTDGKYLELNKAYIAIVGYDRAELIGHLTTEFNIFIDPDQRKEILSQLLANGSLYNYEATIQNKSGERKTVLASLEQIQFNDEPCVLTTLLDITERKSAEEQNRFHANLLASVSDAIIAVDIQLNIQSWNTGAEAMYGWKAEEVIGQPAKEIIQTDFLETTREAATKEVIEKGYWKGEVVQQHRDGTRIPALSSLSLYKDSEGKPAGVVAVNRDITELKHIEEMLRTKNEEIRVMSQQLWQAAKLATMGELAASIAHELNNPLATVSLRAEMLQTQFTPDDAQFKSLQVIDSEIKRMSGLVMNLLQFSRRSSSQISTIRVNEEVINTLELIQYHLRKNSILVVQEFSPETPLIQADRQQLRQVFLNLFTNAADAMPLGGMLTIRTWSGEKPEAGITAPLRGPATQSLGLPVSDSPQIFIEASDTGEGIPPDKLERVWEPFYTTKPEGKGTGLGLAICRRIIQEHGGTIEIISDGIPGKGTTIRLSLPALKER